MKMQIGKWGNSLAIRLPKDLVLKYGLQDGDAIDTAGIEAELAKALEAAVAERREAALERLRKRRWPLPDDWKFDRDEANWRPAMDRW